MPDTNDSIELAMIYREEATRSGDTADGRAEHVAACICRFKLAAGVHDLRASRREPPPLD